MEYNVGSLAKLAGVSARTLRYYDKINLLQPERVLENGYRIYGQKEVNMLQQILFYRELGVPLDEIKRIVRKVSYNDEGALNGHLAALKARRERIDLLIANVEKTIAASKGEKTMNDKEKFEGFKRELVEENEMKYGKEIREKYGDEKVNASNAKVMGMSEEQYQEVQRLSDEINASLKAAFEIGDPACEEAQRVCELHKKWLCYFWKDYSKEAHVGIANNYVDDARFKKHYDDIAEGCAEFLRDAITIYCK